MTAKILWIEGKRAKSPSFVPGLKKKGYQVELVATGQEALARLPGLDPDLVVLNIASFHTTGKRTCRSLRKAVNNIPIVLICETDQENTNEPCANVVLALPFTLRKLLNRIIPLLPGGKGNLQHQGPIRLDQVRKRVYCQGREAHLTPRLTLLLKVLMEHHGEALQRERLFKEVWNTEYTGDTRTLDVHISWLRQAIEENPRQPRFLKTIRGMGYRLDI